MANIGIPYNSAYTGAEVDSSVAKSIISLTQNDVQNSLGVSITQPISQSFFTQTYQYGVKNYAVMPAPTLQLLNVVGLYSGTTTTAFTQSHYYRCQESQTAGFYEWVDITILSVLEKIVTVSGATIELPSNVYSILTTSTDTTISLGIGESGYQNYWQIQIIQGATAYSIALPDGIVWDNNVSPAFLANTTTVVTFWYVGAEMRGTFE